VKSNLRKLQLISPNAPTAAHLDFGPDLLPSIAFRPFSALSFPKQSEVPTYPGAIAMPLTTTSLVRRSSLPLALCAFLLAASAAHTQSLDSRHPAPLQPGPNSGTVDNFVGNNYFAFSGGPGQVTVVVSYNSMSLLGNAQRSTLTVQLSDEKRSWVETRTISSLKQSSSTTMVGNLKVPTRMILSVLPPSGGLVRAGGDYTVTATGAVKFDPPHSPIEQIVGTYTPMSVHDNEDTAAKFEPNGRLEFASGTTGQWKLFDAGSHLYTVTFAQTRLSLKLIPGRGLVDPRDQSIIVFQRTH
jgi:hypothetical protein